MLNNDFQKYLTQTKELFGDLLFINQEENNQFLKLVKDIASKGFIRSNYKEKLIDLSNVRLNLKSKK